MTTTRAFPLAIVAAIGLMAGPAFGEEPPKIGIIFSTSAQPENKQAAELLSGRDGKTVYLDTVNADIATDEHYRIAENCFPTKSADGEPAFSGGIKGEEIPIPIAGKPDCTVMFRIEAADDSPYEWTGGGTGIVNIRVRDTFRVEKQVKDGTVVFKLTPVE
ncbi:MAG: hypothetical protein ACPW61_06775 [Methyloligella sp. ZOD6]